MPEGTAEASDIESDSDLEDSSDDSEEEREKRLVERDDFVSSKYLLYLLLSSVLPKLMPLIFFLFFKMDYPSLLLLVERDSMFTAQLCCNRMRGEVGNAQNSRVLI